MFVDDLVFAEDDLKEINYMKQHLDLAFNIKDLGNLKFYLGLK
jgi:hypothetical protein